MHPEIERYARLAMKEFEWYTNLEGAVEKNGADTVKVVECNYHDAFGAEHIVMEKVPVVTTKNITANDRFPQKGSIRCSLLRKYADVGAGRVVVVSTELPDHVRAMDRCSEFHLFENQIEDRSVFE